MRALPLALVAAALAPAGASAAIPSNLPTDVPLDCWQTRSQNDAGRQLVADRAARDAAAQHRRPERFEAGELHVPRAVHAGRVGPEGGWHVANRTIQFDDGPLADEASGYRLEGRVYVKRQGMQHDHVP